MAHTEASTTLLSSVTAPLRANRPAGQAGAGVLVTLARATMFPTKALRVPSVAARDLPEHVAWRVGAVEQAIDESRRRVMGLPILKMKHRTG